jgi:hypothetical protein
MPLLRNCVSQAGLVLSMGCCSLTPEYEERPVIRKCGKIVEFYCGNVSQCIRGEKSSGLKSGMPSTVQFGSFEFVRAALKRRDFNIT